MSTVLDVLLAFWLVAAQMAPWLLLGFLVAGLLSVTISPSWLEKHLGGRGMGPVWKASLFGVPLPLCSCGVIPVGASLRKHGASSSATTAFLISTPQTGVDSIAVTGALLGPVFAVFRPLMAFVTGVLGGALVQVVEGRQESTTGQQKTAIKRAPRDRLKAALRYGFETLPRDIGKPLMIGLAIAALITVLVPAGSLSGLLGGGLLPILVMMVASIPLYVCATGSVPMAAGFIHAGVSPGAAVAFLIAGPATNAAMIATLLKILGRRTTLVYLATIAGSAVGAGLLLDALFSNLGLHLEVLYTAPCHETISWREHLWAGLLVANLGWVFWPRRGCGTAGEGGMTVHDAAAKAAHGAGGQGVHDAGAACCHCQQPPSRDSRNC